MKVSSERAVPLFCNRLQLNRLSLEGYEMYETKEISSTNFLDVAKHDFFC
jgi:hypothetical protein